ncbi:MAG TPA: hypothetical protein PLR16_06700, partial [Bacilli bacterium]|nr:hypothetical protein [Bacilli bacterium]
ISGYNRLILRWEWMMEEQATTLIACEQLDRICYMMELDEKYVDVIIDRWEKYTGRKAVKVE